MPDCWHRAPSEAGPVTPLKPASAQDVVNMTPGKVREAWGASEPVQVMGVGMGGVEELAQHLDSGTVSWALLRFQVGGGTTARVKWVNVHCNGENTSVIQRGLLNARKGEVLSLLGDVHANVEVVCPKEMTVEYLCERLLPLFAADDMNFSMKELRSEYGKTVREMQEEVKRKQLEAEALRKQLQEESEKAEEAEHVPTRDEALRAVGEEQDSYNWALLEPGSLGLHRAGFGGLEEMKKSLADDHVLFGVVRLSFGYGEGHHGGTRHHHADVTKHVFVHWVGPSVGPVRRGRWNAKLQDAAKLISSCASLTFRREAHSVQDLDLEDLLSEMRRLTVVDRRTAKGGVAQATICAEEYIKALGEEERMRQAAAQALAEEAKRKRDLEEQQLKRRQPAISEARKEQLPDLRTAVEAVSTPSGRWNWVLCGWPRASVAAMPTPSRAGLRSPPSPCRARSGVVPSSLQGPSP